MNAENINTATKFAQSWTSTPEERRVAEIISVFNETHRFTDPWSSFIDEKGIYIKGSEEKTYVGEIIDRDSYLGNIEAQVFDNLENWADQNEEDLACWISPAYPGKYPCSKIIFHQIAYEAGSLNKAVLNAAVLFDSSPQECVALAHQLFPNLKNKITDVELLRGTLIIPGADFQVESVLEEIHKLDTASLNNKPQMTKEELEIKARQISSLIGSGANAGRIAYEMQRQGLLGEHSISCPSASQKLTFSEFSSLSPQRYEFKPGTCRICGMATEVGPCNICRSCEKKL
jgi:hypothetical protein